MILEEIYMGRYEDKILKYELVVKYILGIEDLVIIVWFGDNGFIVVEMLFYGVIGVIILLINLIEIIICNSIGMIVFGNVVVFNGYLGVKKCVVFVVDMINRVIILCGGLWNLVIVIKNLIMEFLDVIIKYLVIKFLCGIGGLGMVKIFLSFGKKFIGVGVGNLFVIVDDIVDIEKVGKSIIEGCFFDNNLLCIVEKEVFVFENVVDDLIKNMFKNNVVIINKD